ncbi:hypothetical protein X560_0800 [Listeria fleischmannii 1991]|jgi:hypothetical protein|uniref:Protein of uncharacterized function (DUF2584) n=5 Tax=Listeria fleischmannii TaxID=1069827 RepID=A0A2X3HAM6_9LIST|nr:DUF2584 domain-containing protein [Listeria fleischmannii]EUJ60876.1 hypothetical protein MCOL2_04321 [Listeria fleischmannii FSL S10-1203]KMT60672.1 hypothetical protein X560_0800 [Listeria fleischmannii 1991]MBC1399656.1 DUF2584 domain-containing protein [Listeria fleischmannii]MBC1427947.1 DUF2584 domain-containing protein [Listeria fleischmannii]SQC69803.1 Protein of uncharacterised function (DUF2584) [Listeria fleischmannii subsp. fleischmannii]
MGMPVEVNTMVVTKGLEKRITDNFFELKKEGYRIYPIDVPIELRKTKDGEVNGLVIPRKLIWEENTTIITYELISLNSSN